MSEVAASTARGLVVVVAPTRAERQRLRASLPEGVQVLTASSRAQALELLARYPEGAEAVSLCPEEHALCFTGHVVYLTRLEFATMNALHSDPGRVWSVDELTREVWASGYVGDGGQVRSVVKRLRRKLVESAAPVLVENVRGAGFRLVGRPVAVVTGAAVDTTA